MSSTVLHVSHAKLPDHRHPEDPTGLTTPLTCVLGQFRFIYLILAIELINALQKEWPWQDK